MKKISHCKAPIRILWCHEKCHIHFVFLQGALADQHFHDFMSVSGNLEECSQDSEFTTVLDSHINNPTVLLAILAHSVVQSRTWILCYFDQRCLNNAWYKSPHSLITAHKWGLGKVSNLISILCLSFCSPTRGRLPPPQPTQNQKNGQYAFPLECFLVGKNILGRNQSDPLTVFMTMGLRLSNRLWNSDKIFNLTPVYD